MKGLIAKTLVGGSLLVASALVIGCQNSPRRADPCWPERYNALARRAVAEPIMAQASNGHILDQTIWNWMFTTDESGKQTLNADGRKHLVYLVRRRPAPDPKVFLQTAHDVSYNPENPEQFVTDRTSLDSERMQVVQDFLNAQSTGRQMAMPFTIVVHDPAPVGEAARVTADVMTYRQELYKQPTNSALPVTGQQGGGGIGGSGGGTSGSSQ